MPKSKRKLCLPLVKFKVNKVRVWVKGINRREEIRDLRKNILPMNNQISVRTLKTKIKI